MLNSAVLRVDLRSLGYLSRHAAKNTVGQLRTVLRLYFKAVTAEESTDVESVVREYFEMRGQDIERYKSDGHHGGERRGQWKHSGGPSGLPT